MIIAKVCVIAAITAVSAFILKANKSELVPLCLAAGGIIMILCVFDYLAESVQLIKTFTEQTGINSSVVKMIFRIIGIGYIVELTASSIKDLGFDSVADKLIMCGRIVIFMVSAPILKNLYEVIMSLIGIV
ncbi:MAG: stage III sporulation AC/AD family protein [Clostridia bacterium]|nr:stage III sporulation AC/AD family protein [Clostridia bacterium]